MMNRPYRSLIALLLFFGMAGHCRAEEINIAVASNALAAVKVICAAFEKQTGHTVSISSGSTGKLYAQIINGAPFDVFLAANEKEPEKLEQSGFTAPGSRFTYALGKLVAWSPDDALLKSDDLNKVLSSKPVTRIAIANPNTAPYGLAAQQVLQKMGIWELLQTKIIRGENVSQTYQFAMTNNAQIGFLARSQIQNDGNPVHNGIKGSYREVPQEFYAPIRQQAVLLLRAQHKSAAKEFIDFLKSGHVKEILTRQFGYGVESSGKNS